MRFPALFAAVAVTLLLSPSLQGEDFYGDRKAVLVERDGKIAGRLPAERIRLDYPELNARAEANAALDSQGNIWAAIGYSVGNRHQDPGGFERLFHSRDGGKTWTSQILPMTEDCHFLGFTVLGDDTLLLVTALSGDDPSWRKLVRVHRSEDRGKTWRETCTLRPDPFEQIGEGFLSMTQLDDGTVLLPITRWTEGGDERELVNAVFASRDGGGTFPVVYPTFRDGHEAHVIHLRSGRLLGAFRYQRPPRPGETPEEIRALGGNPDWAHPTSGKRAKSAFKHVWIGESDDGGRTWKNLRAVRDRHGRALLDFGETHGQLVQVPDGRVVLVHDCRYPYQRAHTRARISRDEGRTWEAEIYHVSDGMGYASSVALSDGTIVTITGSTRLDASFRPMGKWEAQAVRWRLPGKGG
jgi:hypothetical protein